MNRLFIAPLIAVLIHICEEFFFPGGFKEWYVKYRREVKAGLSTGFLFTINTILVAVCALIAWEGPEHGTGTWLIVVAVLFWNAIFHLRGMIKTGKYSPGVVSATLLYLPLGIYGTYQVLQLHTITPFGAIVSIALGSLYHFFSLTRHRIVDKRSKKG